MREACAADRRAAVTITFDGGYAATADRALALLAERQLPSTWFLVADALGGTLEGRAVAGADVWTRTDPALVEVGNHSNTHPLVRRSAAEMVRHVAQHPASVARALGRAVRRDGRAAVPATGPAPMPIPQAEARRDFAVGKARLEEQVGRPVPAFAYPSGRASSRMQSELLRLGHTSARTSRPGWNPPDRLVPMALRAQTWTAATDRAEGRAWLDRAVDTGTWLIEVFHLVEHGSDYPWNVTPETFRAHLDDLQNLGVWVETQSRMFDHLTGGTRSVA